MSKDVIFIMGPTASGKTNLAISLYQTNPSLYELVSVDSALIYKGMDIGTAKPNKEELEKYPHQLIDIIDPAESYNAGQFFKDVSTIIDNCHAQKKIPILVGGTMLYYKTLLGSFNDLPASTPESRKWLAEQAHNYTWNELHERLKDIDIVNYNNLHPNDKQRIGRVLEIHFLTNKPLSSFCNEDKISTDYNIKQIALNCSDRSWLHARIELRFRKMMEEGFINEVQKLFSRGDLNESMPSIRCVGYRQIWDYLLGKDELEEATLKGIYATRQLAKRQITWLRNWNSDVFVIDALQEPKEQLKQLTTFLKSSI